MKKYTRSQLEPNSYYYFKSDKWDRIIETNSESYLTYYVDFNMKELVDYGSRLGSYPAEEIHWEWRKATNYEIQHLNMCKLKNEFLPLNLDNYEIY